MATALPEVLIGAGFYKLAYVTNDREQAIQQWQERFGIEEFARFEPQFDAQVPEGHSGRAHLRCAFSVGRKIVVEVMEPLEGAVGLWEPPLAESEAFAQRFHHFGVIVDNLTAALDAARTRGLHPVLTAGIPNGRFAYLPMHGLGHYVELMEYFEPDGDAFLRRVQTQPLQAA